MEPSILVNNVSKQYRLGTKLAGLRDLFSSRKDDHRSDYRWAVHNVSFDLYPGDALGIIGPNGAGKTTILKMLSKVTWPTIGNIRINGRLSALIELGAGFHPDLTGRENIYLNGTILGMRNAQIKARFDDIVEFSGISEYLDTPVKRYSSGMYARLGFAIAAHVDPEVLLVDEVLAVGDYAFQLRCYARMDDLRAKGTTLIFVSHNMDVVRRVCNKVLVMYRGESVFLGPTNDAMSAYSNAIREASRVIKNTGAVENALSERIMRFDAEVKCVRLLNQDYQPIAVVDSRNEAIIEMEVRFIRDVSQPIFAFFIRTTDGRLVYNTTTRWMNVQTRDYKAGERCLVHFKQNMDLLDGEYELGVDITASDLSIFYDRVERALSFWIKGNGKSQGIADLNSAVTVTDLEKQG
jgi:lipopolysaccharide transport system ATP-binding protein